MKPWIVYWVGREIAHLETAVQLTLEIRYFYQV